MQARYEQWDGSQDPFGPDLDVGEILDEISDDILSGYGAQAAMRRLMRRGMPGRLGGLDDLRRRLEAQRRRATRELNLEGAHGGGQGAAERDPGAGTGVARRPYW